jgi:hypothetical protein
MPPEDQSVVSHDSMTHRSRRAKSRTVSKRLPDAATPAEPAGLGPEGLRQLVARVRPRRQARLRLPRGADARDPDGARRSSGWRSASSRCALWRPARAGSSGCAERMRWRQICVRMGCVRSTAWRRRTASLITIANHLNQHGKSSRSTSGAKTAPARGVAKTASGGAGTRNCRRHASNFWRDRCNALGAGSWKDHMNRRRRSEGLAPAPGASVPPRRPAYAGGGSAAKRWRQMKNRGPHFGSAGPHLFLFSETKALRLSRPQLVSAHVV